MGGNISVVVRQETNVLSARQAQAGGSRRNAPIVSALLQRRQDSPVRRRSVLDDVFNLRQNGTGRARRPR
jgi:hypothetical protein